MTTDNLRRGSTWMDGIGVFPNIPEDVYFADTANLSQSGAKLLLPPSCPAKFKQVREAREKPKRVWDVGSLCHKIVLGAGADIVVIEAGDYRTKAAQNMRDEARDSGLIPALRKEVEAAELMNAKLREHDLAGELFKSGDAELSCYATDPESGVLLRARFDWYTFYDGRVVVVDYKTAADANPDLFARKAVEYGYHIQAAWYYQIAQLLELDTDPRVLFVVQEKQPPYLVSVVELDQDALYLGVQRKLEAIRIYQWCVENDCWPGWGGGINTVSLPAWAYK
jgi:hypothetical protein